MKDLAARYLDGTASDAEVEELSALLRSDARAREEYLRLASVHARLATDTSLWIEKQRPSSPTPRWRAWALPSAVTATAAALLMTVVLWTAQTRVTPTPVATLLLARDAVWSGDSPLEGARVNRGLLRLQGGRALLRLDGGALLTLNGASETRIESGGRVRLLAGEIHARVPEASAGFTIHTPHGDVVDLGTEFVTRVIPDQQTEVTVVTGEVEVKPIGGVAQHLVAGQAAAINTKGSISEIAARASQPDWDEWTLNKPRSQRSYTLLAQESFDYPEGSHDPATLNGGKGWLGPWSIIRNTEWERRYWSNSNDIVIRASDAGKAWVSPKGKNYRQRRLAKPLDLGRDSIRYVSVAWFEEQLLPEQRTPTSRPTSSLMLAFRSLKESVRERISLRVDHLLRPRIETDQGEGFISRLRVPEGTRLLLVAKILSRRNGEDEVLLRVFHDADPPGAWEPDVWDIRTLGLRFDVSLDHVILLSSGPQPRRIDEVRMGSTWQDVVAGWEDGMTMENGDYEF